jgi:hypothetical protein
MDSYEDKINNLTDRIKVIDDKILDLTQTKINLMMLKRDFNQEMCNEEKS